MKLKKGKKISSIVLAFAGCLVLFLAVGFVQFFTVRVAMAVEQDYRFEQSLPEIGKQMPQIISGPVYKGVVAFDGRSRTVSIIAECRESDYHRVEREMMRSLNVLCVENDIKLQ